MIATDLKSVVDATDYDIELVRQIRRKAISQLTKDGTVVPQDTEELAALSKLLADKDRQALSLKKLKIEAQAADDGAQSAKIVAQLLTQLTGEKMQQMFAQGNGAVPELSSDAPMPEIVPGMLDADPGNETYDTFKKKMSQDSKE